MIAGSALVLVVFAAVCRGLLGDAVHDNDCTLYVAPSFIPGAVRGIIAGVDFNIDDTIQESTSILIRTDHIRHWQLFNYVFSAEDEDYSMALFGGAMLFNHRDPATIEHVWHRAPVKSYDLLKNVYSQPYTAFTTVDYNAAANILAGEEIFTSYGDGDDWFSSRGISFVPFENSTTSRYSAEYLKKNGHCLTDIYTDHSDIPLAGKGVFARKAFKKGEIVSISPALVLPRHSVVKANDHSVLINYCICSPGSDAAIMPIGLAGMFNHGGSRANLEMAWYEWSDPSTSSEESRLTWDIARLEKLPYAPLDIKYVASRDIAVGEELLISYGAEWERAWLSYVDEVIAWTEKYGGDGIVMRPQFRQPISAPDGMFPENFMSECIGSTGCYVGSRLEKRKKVAASRTSSTLEMYKNAKSYSLENFISENKPEL
eukprot:CAMPEP_0185033988 /NCGR_PEP_ID=MMETSP1103-20130426/23456_1 /TAXON_ID=36769 /ORGANISM="Paraphysomonas bandaiensis, Strain Caron Lab Isolate" /LENGTH=428 /DNA_ID=CAMNT_0027570461 /DNA_START=21 /DNA_END=1304 /DNA_ORIENTATION=-